MTPILLSIGALGVGREIVPGAALGRIAPEAVRQFTTAGDRIPMSVSASTWVLVAWAVVALAFGAWRTVTRDA